MTQSPDLRLVDPTEEIPEYPVELTEARMTSDYFTMFWHDRWLYSETCLKADLEVQGAALNLFFLARKQTPVGSLPDDSAVLASLLRIDLEQWGRLCGRAITPLNNWRRYRYDNKVILGHPVVIEVALDAVHRREVREAAQNDKATSMRLKRLGELMIEIGCDARMTQDKILLERLDAWLLENHVGQRRMPRFEASMNAALRHAVQVGWINGGR